MNYVLVPLTSDISFKRIVVINTAFLGDLVLTIPFLHLLKKKYPKSFVTLVCKKGIGELFLKLKLVDQVIEVQKGTANDYSEASSQLNKYKQDIVFCIHRSIRSFIFSLSIKTQMRVGYQLHFNFLGYKRKIKRDLALPEPLRIMQLLTVVDESFAAFFSQETSIQELNSKDANGRMNSIPNWAKYQHLNISNDSIDTNPLFLEVLNPVPSGSKRIAIFPGSVWNTKRWPVESFAALIDRLSELDYSIAIMGGPGEEIYGEQIVKLLSPNTNITNLIGKSSVWESTVILNNCDLVVANDSASGHMAALLGKKALVFFGPTVLSFGYRPWGNSVFVMENTQIKCRPCGAHGPKVCPIRTHVCMTSVSAESAFKKIQYILNFSS